MVIGSCSMRRSLQRSRWASSFSTAAHTHSIATVDFGGWYSSDEEKRVVSHSLLSAVETTGFALLKNTPLTGTADDSLANTALESAERFFRSSSEEKKALASSDGSRGYYQYTNSIPDDQIEAFNIGNDKGAVASRRPYFTRLGIEEEHWRKSIVSDHNQWPAQPNSEFERVMKNYYCACSTLSADICEALGLALGLSPHWHSGEGVFTPVHSRGDHILELKRYVQYQTHKQDLPDESANTLNGESGKSVRPPTSMSAADRFLQYQKQKAAHGGVGARGSGQDSRVRVTAHADQSLVTLLVQDRQGGLEVLDKVTGSWMPVPADPSLVLVNTGDYMRSYTAGLLPSTPHRVALTDKCAEQDRLSIVFFHFPDWDAPLLPLTDPEHREGESEGEVTMCGDAMPF